VLQGTRIYNTSVVRLTVLYIRALQGICSAGVHAGKGNVCKQDFAGETPALQIPLEARLPSIFKRIYDALHYREAGLRAYSIENVEQGTF